MENINQLISGGISVLISFLFFIAGLIQYLFPPKKISHLYGYRTPRSMKNQENWNFAQPMNAKALMYTSVIYLTMSLFINLILGYFFPNLDTYYTVPIILVVLTIIGMFFYCEKKLKKFEEGN